MIKNLSFKVYSYCSVFDKYKLHRIKQYLRLSKPYIVSINSKISFKYFTSDYQQSLCQETMNTFKFSDYDCIGFDLDSTIIRYNIKNLIQVEYSIITNFLIDKKGYNPKVFKESLTDEDFNFIQKGLFLDFERGNILKLTSNGNIHSASHGTKILTDEQIEKYYPNKEWEISKIFSNDPLITWNGPLSLKIRTSLDCFDMSIILVFAKAVDLLDGENGKPLDKYNIWPDILDALAEMYSREQLKNNAGYFYPEMKNNPAKYIYKCDPKVLAWIRKLKETKKTYLITGSNSDFAELTTGYAFDEDWKSLFDIIVCYAKKPAFFTDTRPFYSIKNNYENEIVSGEELQVGKIYNQGNWKDLYKFFSGITGVSNPKCLYVGDNMLQDIYAPVNYVNCDTVVIVEEQVAEKMLHHNLPCENEFILNSDIWGSFFCLKDSTGCKESFWNYIIKKNAKICIPQLEVVANKPLDQPLTCFAQEDEDRELKGYHPEKPVSLSYL